MIVSTHRDLSGDGLLTFLELYVTMSYRRFLAVMTEDILEVFKVIGKGRSKFSGPHMEMIFLKVFLRYETMISRSLLPYLSAVLRAVSKISENHMWKFLDLVFQIMVSGF